MVRKRSIGVTIFGWVFLVSGLVLPVYLYWRLHKILSWSFLSAIGLSFEKYCPYARFFMPFLFLVGMFYCLIYIICGIGILRLKCWARYVIIVQLVSVIMGPFNTALLFGKQKLNLNVFLGVIMFSLVLWFFMRGSIKKQFETEGTRFSLKSKYGVLIYVIIFLTLLTPVSALIFKVYFTSKWREPLFTVGPEVVAPEIIRLQEVEVSSVSEKHRKVELFNTSLLIPRDFVIISFDKDEWLGLMGNVNHSGNSKGVIALWLNEKSIFGIGAGIGEAMGFQSVHDFERAFHTNNWSPVFMLLRKVGRLRGKLHKLEEIDSPETRGFVKCIRSENSEFYQCSFHGKEGQGSRELNIMCGGVANSNRGEVLRIVSSLKFLNQQEVEADKYYREGSQFLESGDAIEAQFKFANAYYLCPDNPEHGYVLAKMLFNNGRKDDIKSSYRSANRILEDVLELEPDYKDAKELLETIKSELTSSSESDSK